MALPVIAAPLLLGLLAVVAAPLLLGLLAVSGASGGVPRSCPPNTICLKDYNKEEFHRLTIDCRGLTAILDEYGDIFGRNVSYNNVSRCITRRDGILADCAVTETDYDGRKTKVPITYNCTEGAAAVEIRSVYLEECIPNCRIVCGKNDFYIEDQIAKIAQDTAEGCCATLKETFTCEKPFIVECTCPNGTIIRPSPRTGCDDPTSTATPMTVPTSTAPPMTVPTSAAPRSTDLQSNRGLRIAVVAASICMVILTGIFITWKSRKILARAKKKRLCRQISGGDAASPPDLEHGAPECVILNGNGICNLHHLQKTKL